MGVELALVLLAVLTVAAWIYVLVAPHRLSRQAIVFRRWVIATLVTVTLLLLVSVFQVAHNGVLFYVFRGSGTGSTGQPFTQTDTPYMHYLKEHHLMPPYLRKQ